MKNTELCSHLLYMVWMDDAVLAIDLILANP
jgi:hypothetical protein